MVIREECSPGTFQRPSRRKEKEEYLYICESAANSNISSSSSFTGRLCGLVIDCLSLCVWLIVWVSSVWFIVIEEEDWSVSVDFLTFLLFLWKENDHLLDKLPFTALNRRGALDRRGIDFNRLVSFPLFWSAFLYAFLILYYKICVTYWRVSIDFLFFLLFLWKENGHLLEKLPFTALNRRGIDFNR